MDVPVEMLLHPELLTNEQLSLIIQQRHLRVLNVQSMGRDELLELFHQYCVPYGQRRYRDSGRGKILNKTRHIHPELIPEEHIIQSRKITHLQYNEKIKPPPDLLSGHMKRIKLENNLPVNKVDNIKRKMAVDPVLATDSPPPKKDKKPITWP